MPVGCTDYTTKKLQNFANLKRPVTIINFSMLINGNTTGIYDVMPKCIYDTINIVLTILLLLNKMKRLQITIN